MDMTGYGIIFSIFMTLFLAVWLFIFKSPGDERSGASELIIGEIISSIIFVSIGWLVYLVI